jgi:phosphoserine phosphatase RsbU/P
MDETQKTTGGEDDATLRWYMERLKILNDVHAALGASINLEASLALILDRVFDHLGPEQGAVFLRDGDGAFHRVASRNAHPGLGDIECPGEIVREAAAGAPGALVLDTGSEKCHGILKGPRDPDLHSVVAEPLLDPDDSWPLGMILISSKLPVHHISQMDQQLLASLASLAAMRVRNATLTDEAAERRRLEEELELARRIQVALLPEQLPEIPGYELFGVNLPSRGVSGDFYKVEERRGGWECVLWVADVCGKGVSASLLMASLEALSAAPITEGLDPDEIFVRVSHLLYERTPEERFATAFLAVLEPRDGRVRYANAGHNPALVLRADGRAEWLDATGIPLGILKGYGYTMRRLELAPGDLMILYTDGVTEAMSPSGEEFGADRFAEVCARHRARGLKALSRALEEELESFASGTPFDDDRTLLAVRRLPERESTPQV